MKTLTSIIFIIFISLITKGQDIVLSHKLVNDIRSNYNNVKFISSEAYVLSFQDTLLKNEFMNSCLKHLSKTVMQEMFQSEVKSFLWDNSKLSGIKVISFDSLLKYNDKVKTVNYFINVSTPIFDSKKDFAVLHILYQYPSYELGGGACYYLFKNINDKWTELERVDCIDY